MENTISKNYMNSYREAMRSAQAVPKETLVGPALKPVLSNPALHESPNKNNNAVICFVILAGITLIGVSLYLKYTKKIQEDKCHDSL